MLNDWPIQPEVKVVYTNFYIW